MRGCVLGGALVLFTATSLAPVRAAVPAGDQQSDDERALRAQMRANPRDAQALADLALVLEKRGRVGPAINALLRLQSQDVELFRRVGGPARLEELEATVRSQAVDPTSRGVLFHSLPRTQGGFRAFLRSLSLDGFERVAIRAWHAPGEPVHEDRPVTVAAGAYFRTRGPVVDDRFRHDAAALHALGHEPWAWLDLGSLRESGVPITAVRLRRLARDLAAQGAVGVLLDERSVRGSGEELLRALAGAADSGRGPGWGVVLRPWEKSELDAGLATALDGQARWILVRAASPPRAGRAQCEFVTTVSAVLAARPEARARVMVFTESVDREHASCREALASLPRANLFEIHGDAGMPGR